MSDLSAEVEGEGVEEGAEAVEEGVRGVEEGAKGEKEGEEEGAEEEREFGLGELGREICRDCLPIVESRRFFAVSLSPLRLLRTSRRCFGERRN